MERERSLPRKSGIKDKETMNLLTMEHVTKSYTDRVLLDDVAFGINENETNGDK